MAFRVIRVDQGRGAADFSRHRICEIVGLFQIAQKLESSSYECTESAPLACCRIRWVYLKATFIPRERRATPMLLVRNEHTGSFDNGPSEGL